MVMVVVKTQDNWIHICVLRLASESQSLSLRSYLTGLSCYTACGVCGICVSGAIYRWYWFAVECNNELALYGSS